MNRNQQAKHSQTHTNIKYNHSLRAESIGRSLRCWERNRKRVMECTYPGESYLYQSLLRPRTHHNAVIIKKKTR